MSLDVSTLMFAGGLMMISSSVVLLICWWQDKTAWSAFWWALANSMHGCGVMLLALLRVLPPYVSGIVTPLLLNGAAILTFAAARIFNRGSADPAVMAAGALAWIALQAIAGAMFGPRGAMVLGMAVSGAWFAAAAMEFWLQRGEPIRGRMPMIITLGLFSASLVMTAIETVAGSGVDVKPPIGWLDAIHFVGLFYALGVSLFLSMMLKDRSELRYRRAALVDPLTELANRRGFMDQAQRVFDRQAGDQVQPMAMLAFDLDHFKRINDTFGHAMGDRVLRVFAEVLTATLRSMDIAGRLGGEEFAAIVLGVGEEAAGALATRIRLAFQRAAMVLDSQRIAATVSIGVACVTDEASSVPDMLAAADAALYRAKHEGRNCTVVAARASRMPRVDNVVRIA